MKVALLHAHFGGHSGGGGGVRQMTNLAIELRALGEEPVICCHDYDPEGAFADEAGGPQVVCVRRGAYEVPVGARKALRQAYRWMPRLAEIVPRDADIVNAHEYPAIVAGRAAARRLGVPLVWTRNDYTVWEFALMPHETPVPPMRAPARALRLAAALPDRCFARAADAIVVLDRRNARMVARAYKREARIVRSGPAAHFFDPPPKTAARRALGLAPDGFLVLGVGIMLPHRRFEDLIDAVARLDPALGVRARIVGSDHIDPAYAELLAARIARLGCGDRVDLLRESISDDELLANYAAADLFVFPNNVQTWGLAPLEALAAGTPVIVSRGAGVHEVLAERAGVQLCAPGDAAQLAERISAVAADPAAFDPAPTRVWIHEHLNNRRYAEQMRTLFAELIARRR